MTILQPASNLKTALLLVDIQQGLTVEAGYYGTERSTPEFDNNVAALLAAARKYNEKVTHPSDQIFVAHVCHDSTDPESPLWPSKATNKIQPRAAPAKGEPLIRKSVNCAFVGTNLEQVLRNQDIRQLFIFGIATDHCVSTTVRLAADLGIVKRKEDALGLVAVVSDATAAFNNRGKFDAETVHAVNLASLEDEFAEIVSTKDVLVSVLGEAHNV